MSTTVEYVSIVFMQGEEASEVLDIIEERGKDEGVEYLSQWDYGDETESAAEFWGHVYPTEYGGAKNDPLVRQFEHGDYSVVYNWNHEWVHLLRRRPATASEGV